MTHHPEIATLDTEHHYEILVDMFPGKAIAPVDDTIYRVDCLTHTHDVAFDAVMDTFTKITVNDPEPVDLPDVPANDLADLLQGLIDLLRKA